MLVAIQHAGFGGVHALIENQVPLLRCRGIELRVVCGDDETAGPDRLRAAGVHVTQIPYPRIRKCLNPLVHARYLFTFRATARKIARLAHEWDADLLQATGLMNLQAGLASHMADIPLVWQINGTFAPPGLRKILCPFVRRWADGLLVEGRGVLAAHAGLVDFPSQFLRFFYPGVDLNRFAPDPVIRQNARKELGVADHELLIGTVGNRNHAKGHEFLVEAAAAFVASQTESSVCFRVLGAHQPSNAAYYEKEVVHRARSLGLLENGTLQFLDPGTRVHKLLPGFDVFVLPSRAEGVGTVTLEAQACGIPVIASDVGSVSEVVLQGETGLLVAPGSVKDLESALRQLIGDPELRSRMGARGRERVREHFTAEHTAQTFASLYHEVRNQWKLKRKGQRE